VAAGKPIRNSSTHGDWTIGLVGPAKEKANASDSSGTQSRPAKVELSSKAAFVILRVLSAFAVKLSQN